MYYKCKHSKCLCLICLISMAHNHSMDAVFSCARNSNVLHLWQGIWNVIYNLAFCQSLVSVWFQLSGLSLYWKRSEKPTGNNPILSNMSVLTGYILLLELIIQVFMLGKKKLYNCSRQENEHCGKCLTWWVVSQSQRYTGNNYFSPTSICN